MGIENSGSAKSIRPVQLGKGDSNLVINLLAIKDVLKINCRIKFPIYLLRRVISRLLASAGLWTPLIPCEVIPNKASHPAAPKNDGINVRGEII